MLRIGLNGFGRIGRAVTRILSDRPESELVVVNELNPDLRNLVYLLKYDSLYGRFEKPVRVESEDETLLVDKVAIQFYSHRDIRAVPWEEHGIDVLIEATGVDANAVAAHELINRGIPKVVITNAHCAVDATMILGVNEDTYDASRHNVISSSICDANAIAPILYELDKCWGVESCFITTLHPWLSYQNLLDGTVASVASPGHSWKDYSLGRASVLSLIPKDTTAAKATLAVLPRLEGRLDAISFRVPTHIVSASDICAVLGADVSAEEVNAHFAERARAVPRIFGFEQDHLVSIDYLRTTQSTIVDARRTKVLNGRLLKIVTWYDNEWGYSSRVVDVAALVAEKRQNALSDRGCIGLAYSPRRSGKCM